MFSKRFENAVLERLESSANVFSETNQKLVCWKIFEWVGVFLGFWLCWGSIFFTMLSELRLVQWVRFFEWNCIAKWVIIFARFCWLWDFLLENPKLKYKQIWDFESVTFWSKFCFLGLFQGCFSQCHFKIFLSRSTMMVTNVCTKHPPPLTPLTCPPPPLPPGKISYGPEATLIKG